MKCLSGKCRVFVRRLLYLSAGSVDCVCGGIRVCAVCAL